MAVSRGKNGTRQVHDPHTGRIVTNLAGDSAKAPVVSKPPGRPKKVDAATAADTATPESDIKTASKRVTARQKKIEQVQERFEQLDEIDTKMKNYKKDYDRSAARDLMSKKHVANVLAALGTGRNFDFYSEYTSEDADDILTAIVLKEGKKSGEVLDSFVADKDNAFDYLLHNGYVKSLDTLKEECWDILQEDGIEAMRARLTEEVQKCPAAHVVWKEFNDIDMSHSDDYTYAGWED